MIKPMSLKELVTRLCISHDVDIDEFMIWAFGNGYKEAENVFHFCLKNWKHADRFELRSDSNVFEDLKIMLKMFEEDRLEMPEDA